MDARDAAVPPEPDFRSPAFLREHIARTMAFYDRAGARDPTGGFFHFFRDDGRVYDRTTRHLVSSTRFVVTHALAARRFGGSAGHDWREGARHGLAFVDGVHRDAQSGGYAWQLRWDGAHATVLDATHFCYGLAFVLLAQAHAALAGIAEARPMIGATFDLMERHFWEPANGLYADEAAAGWRLSTYRGQNANMHACEAMLAAFDATGEAHFLDRAQTLADAVTRGLAAMSPGVVERGIWEHYRHDAAGRWVPDPDYNRGDRSNIFRPWGFQPGHFTEWAKLLLTLDARRPTAWLLPRARELFDTALAHAWDDAHGGLVYGFAPDGRWCDDDKYFWVQAETIAAAARLALRCDGEAARGCWHWYDRVWAYAWRHFVDHRHGAWYRILARDNRRLSDEKSPAGKVDYHTMGACHDVLEALGA